MIKVIGIGNLLMGDDGIALKIIDSIKRKVKQLDLEIQCIKAETDFDFALDNIDDGDFIFILDGMLMDLESGQVIKVPLTQGKNLAADSLSIHSISLLTLISQCNLIIEGFIIGIQVKEVKFSLEVSSELRDKFQQICDKVYTIIKESSLEHLKTGENNA